MSQILSSHSLTDSALSVAGYSDFFSFLQEKKKLISDYNPKLCTLRHKMTDSSKSSETKLKVRAKK